MEVVDASVLVAVLQRQAPFHQVRRVWFEAYLQVGGQLAAPLFVMSEVAMDVRARSSASRQASVPARWPLS
jgi:predicted nucleic acid-binding protein